MLYAATGFLITLRAKNKIVVFHNVAEDSQRYVPGTSLGTVRLIELATNAFPKNKNRFTLDF